jgi:hypothetical protein
MSKVKIQGNASGTGVVTLTAPNTNTDRTITLPDGTQTLIGADASGDVTVSASGADASRTLSLQGTNGSSEVYQFNLIADGGNSAAKFMVGAGGGAATEKLRIQSGGGISFNGDTAAANALDDYEEGTWTGTGSSITIIEEKYTKIGRLVHLYFEVNFSGASGNLTVAGLPYTASPDGAVGIGREDASNGYAVYARINVSNQINIYYAGSTSNATPYQVGTGNFKISITYNV